MRCAECNIMCKGKIYDSHLEAMEIQFANIVTQIIAGVKVKKGKKTRFAPDVHGHRSDLCEACQTGVCCMAGRTLKGWKDKEKAAKRKKPRRKSGADTD